VLQYQVNIIFQCYIVSLILFFLLFLLLLYISSFPRVMQKKNGKKLCILLRYLPSIVVATLPIPTIFNQLID